MLRVHNTFLRETADNGVASAGGAVFICAFLSVAVYATPTTSAQPPSNFANRGAVETLQRNARWKPPRKGGYEDSDKHDAELDALLGKNAAVAKAYVRQGKQLLAGCESEQAIDIFNKAIQLCPNYGVAFYCRGQAYADLKKLDEALKDFKKSSNLDHQCAYHAMIMSWQLNMSRKNYAQAVKDLDFLISLKAPMDDISVYTKRGYAFLEMGNAEEALANAHKALEHDPKGTRGWLLSARALNQLNRLPESADAYCRAIKENRLAKTEDRLRTPSEDPVRLLRERVKVYEKLGKTALAAADRNTIKQMENADFNDAFFRSGK